jgi:hypothetical protein
VILQWKSIVSNLGCQHADDQKIYRRLADVTDIGDWGPNALQTGSQNPSEGLVVFKNSSKYNLGPIRRARRQTPPLNSCASPSKYRKVAKLYFLYLTASLHIKQTIPTASVSALRDSHCAGSKHVEHAIRRPRPRAHASQLVAGRRTYPKTVSRLHSASTYHDIRTTILLTVATMI